MYVDSFMAMKGKDFVGKAPRQNAVLETEVPTVLNYVQYLSLGHQKAKIPSFSKKITRCRLVPNLTILSIFVDFSMKKSLEFPISLRQLDLKYLKNNKYILFWRENSNDTF